MVPPRHPLRGTGTPRLVFSEDLASFLTFILVSLLFLPSSFYALFFGWGVESCTFFTWSLILVLKTFPRCHLSVIEKGVCQWLCFGPHLSSEDLLLCQSLDSCLETEGHLSLSVGAQLGKGQCGIPGPPGPTLQSDSAVVQAPRSEPVFPTIDHKPDFWFNIVCIFYHVMESR